MDAALRLVEAYLRVNGFFTVAEYPILGPTRSGTREVTDVDILAIRLPWAGRVLPRSGKPHGTKTELDPLLQVRFGTTEMLIGEVKQGVARMNAPMRNRSVLFEAMRRFGVCDRSELTRAARALSEHGVAETSAGRIRLVAFGTQEADAPVPFLFVPLQSIMAFLDAYVDKAHGLSRSIRFRDPALSFLALRDKTRAPDQGKR